MTCWNWRSRCRPAAMRPRCWTSWAGSRMPRHAHRPREGKAARRPRSPDRRSASSTWRACPPGCGLRPCPGYATGPGLRRPDRAAGNTKGAARRPSCLCLLALASEAAAEGELQALQLVAFLLAERERVADRDRAHRGAPQQGHAGGGAQLAAVEVVDAVVHVAEVDEGRDARGIAVEQLGEHHLDLADGLQRAAHRLAAVAGDDLRARTQGVVAEAAHRAGAAGVEVLEERQPGSGDGLAVAGRVRRAGIGGGAVDRDAQVAGGLAAVAVAIAQVQAGAQHERRAQAPVARELVAELVVLGG